MLPCKRKRKNLTMPPCKRKKFTTLTSPTPPTPKKAKKAQATLAQAVPSPSPSLPSPPTLKKAVPSPSPSLPSPSSTQTPTLAQAELWSPPPPSIVNDVFHLNLTDRQIQNKKHYYFYGPYDRCKGMMMRFIKAVPPNDTALMYDPPSFNNVQSYTKYILIDHYSWDNCLNLLDLFDLTSSFPSCMFQASRRTFQGQTLPESYVPRDDVQLLIWSQYHPFHVYQGYMRSKDTIMFRSRFHIIKLDAPERCSGRMPSERAEATKYLRRS